jgi:hypothetical protein
MTAQVVRQFELAAIRAFLEGFGAQRVVAAAHIPPGRRCFSLGDCHLGTCSICQKMIGRASPMAIAA